MSDAFRNKSWTPDDDRLPDVDRLLCDGPIWDGQGLRCLPGQTGGTIEIVAKFFIPMLLSTGSATLTHWPGRHTRRGLASRLPASETSTLTASKVTFKSKSRPGLVYLYHDHGTPSSSWIILNWPDCEGQLPLISMHHGHTTTQSCNLSSSSSSSDLAVGAPYGGREGRGAVYVFLGSREGVVKKPSQVTFHQINCVRCGS